MPDPMDDGRTRYRIVSDDDLLSELPDLGELPEIPDLDFGVREAEEHEAHGEAGECPVCRTIEDRICRPHMKHGDPHQCALDIIESQRSTVDRPEEERKSAVLKVFEKYGIDPNGPIASKAE